MTVYVDNMRAKYGRMIMCHMVADTDEELHEMADRIGVARKWFQGDHYDICLGKRSRALDLGAQSITIRQAAAFTFMKKRGSLMRPEYAVEAMMSHFKGK